MRTTPFVLIAISFGLALGCTDRSTPIAANDVTPKGTWVSDQASLTISGSSASVRVLAAGCVGSFGEIQDPIPEGDFSLPGTYTQLIGAYPGRLNYSAEYTGTSDGNHLTLEINVAGLPQPIGPFDLSSGTDPAWPQCAYP